MLRMEVEFPQSLWAQVQRLIDAGYYADAEDFILSVVKLQIERMQSIHHLKDKQWIELKPPASMKDLRVALHQVVDTLLEIDEELHPSSTTPFVSHLVTLKGVAEYLRQICYVGSKNSEIEPLLTPIRRLLLIEDRGESITLEDVGIALEAIIRYGRGDKDRWPGGQLEQMREAAQIARWVQSASTKINLIVDMVYNVIDRLSESTGFTPVQGEEE